MEITESTRAPSVPCCKQEQKDPCGPYIRISVAWNERGICKSKPSFNFTHYKKSRGFNSDVLSVRGESIRFIPENMEVDVDVFEKLIRLAESSKDMNEREKLLRSAVELYKGDFLPEDIYEDWSTPYREYYREQSNTKF